MTLSARYLLAGLLKCDVLLLDSCYILPSIATFQCNLMVTIVTIMIKVNKYHTVQVFVILNNGMKCQLTTIVHESTSRKLYKITTMKIPCLTYIKNP